MEASHNRTIIFQPGIKKMYRIELFSYKNIWNSSVETYNELPPTLKNSATWIQFWFQNTNKFISQYGGDFAT
jgi:hypothetical protein